MARLPVINGDEDYWGNVLVEFLQVEHDSDGTLKRLKHFGYNAIVYIDGSSIIARDYKGDLIASGTAGTDDASVLQSTHDNIQGNIYIASGTYHINNTINVTKSRMTFLMDSNAELKCETNDYMFNVNGAWYTFFIGGRIVGDGSHTGGFVKLTGGALRVFLIRNIGYELLGHFCEPVYDDTTPNGNKEILMSDLWLNDCAGLLYCDASAATGKFWLGTHINNVRYADYSTSNPCIEQNNCAGVRICNISDHTKGRFFSLTDCHCIYVDTCFIESSDEEDIYIKDSSQIKFVNLGCQNSGKDNIYIDNSTHIVFIGCRVNKANYNGIHILNSAPVHLLGLTLGAVSQAGSGLGYYGVKVDTSYQVIIDNFLVEAGTNADAAFFFPASNKAQLGKGRIVSPSTIWNNRPYFIGNFNYGSSYLKSKNEGSATIANGNTSVTVNHGLLTTPTNIQLTGTHSEVKDAYVTNPGATSFDITVDNAVSADRTVYWKAKV